MSDSPKKYMGPNGAETINPGFGGYLLLESEGYLLQEDDGRLIL